MDFNSFKVLYAEVMMNYQLLEHDIKFIYSFMRDGDINDNLKEISDFSLGEMINLLKDLDNSDLNPLLSPKDYAMLNRLCKNRNHWAHSTFVNFMYEDEFINSKEYKKECANLEKDNEKIDYYSDIFENIRIEFCDKTNR